MPSPLLLFFPDDPNNPILPLHLQYKEEKEVFIAVGLIRGVLRDGDDRVPPPHTPTTTTETFSFPLASEVSVSSFNTAGLASGAANMMTMATSVAEARGRGGTGETKNRRRKV